MRLWICILPLTVGCASGRSTDAFNDSAPGGADLDFESNQLRIDVYPGQDAPTLSPQSWIAGSDTDWTNIGIDIKSSVSVTGRVVGYEANPLHAEVPGADRQPVDATISLIRVGTITGASAVTDEDGEFELSVPPARGYQLSIVPAEGSVLPFHVSTHTTIMDPIDLETIDLGYGVPVYGFITDHTGAAVEGALVSLEHAASGIRGPSTTTDETGHYLLRAHPDDYILEIRGKVGHALPKLRLPAPVAATTGLAFDVDIGNLETVTIAGQVFGPDGIRALGDVRVRLSSEQLASSEGALEIDTETDGDGLFSRSVLPGNWLAEFIPEYDSPIGARQMTFSVERTRVDLGSLPLPSRVPFSSAVLDPDGIPVEGAAVNAQETAFDRYIFSTSSDTEGLFSLDLPPHPVNLRVSPPSAELAVTKVLIDPVNDRGTVYLSRGEPVRGQVTTNGQPVRFSLIEVRNLHGTLHATALTDNQGRFEVRIEDI
jgi:hypothetical protein